MVGETLGFSHEGLLGSGARQDYLFQTNYVRSIDHNWLSVSAVLQLNDFELSGKPAGCVLLESL